MLTSIDKEGTKKGFDNELNKIVSEIVTIPIISSGGAGNSTHILNYSKNQKLMLLHWPL